MVQSSTSPLSYLDASFHPLRRLQAEVQISILDYLRLAPEVVVVEPVLLGLVVEGELGSAEEEHRARPRDMDGQAVITSTLTALALTRDLVPPPVATVALQGPDPGLPQGDEAGEETVTMIMMMIGGEALAMTASEVVVARVVVVGDIARLG